MIGFKLLSPLNEEEASSPSGVEAEVEGYLELDEGTSIEMQLKNPIFADDGVIPSTYTIPFDIPASDLNAEKLGRPHVIEHASKFKKAVPVRLDFNRVPWLTGQLNIRNVNERKYSVNFLSGINNLGDDFKNARLRDVVSEEIVLANNPIDKNIKIGISSLAPAGQVLTVNGQSYTIETGQFSAIIDTINADDETIDAIWHSNGENSFPYPNLSHWTWAEFRHKTESSNPLSALSVMADSHYWRLVVDWMDDYYPPLVAAILAYNNDPDSDIIFPFMRNELCESKWVNRVYNGNFLINSVEDIYTHTDEETRRAWDIHNINSIVPCIRLRYVFEKIEEAYGIKIKGDFVAHATIQKLFWWNGNSLNANMAYVGEKNFDFWRRDFNVNEFLPDLTLAEFFKEIQLFFCLEVNYDIGSNAIKMNFRKPIIQNRNYIDITSKASKYDDLDNTEQGGITLSSKAEKDAIQSGDLKNPFKPLVIGDGAVKVETEISGVYEKIQPLPFLNEIIYLEYAHQFSDAFPPRLFFDAGMASQGASTWRSGRQTIDGVTLAWGGATGLYENFWKDYARFLTIRAKVQRNINFDIADLLSLDWKQKYRIDRVNYLIESITVRMTMKGMKAGKAELWKCG